jgi:hypothetical protein
MKQLKKSKRAAVLQDAEAYQRLLDIAAGAAVWRPSAKGLRI